MIPKTILYDFQVFAAQKYGGVSRIFYELIKHLADEDKVRLNLFLGFYMNEYPLRDFKNKAADYFGVKIPCRPRLCELVKPFNRMLFNVLSVKPVDIYHPTGFSSEIQKWKKSPVVLTVFDMIPELFPRHFPDIRARRENKRKCVERADRVIAISHNTSRDLQNYFYIPANKIKVIYLGVLSEYGEQKRIDPFIHKKPFILYVGTRKQWYKNFDGLLRAFAASERVRNEFDLVCFGGPSFTADECGAMSRLNVRDNVCHLAGDDRQLLRLYRGATAMIYPSHYEGFGLPPLEAMACGCPVLSSTAPPMPEILGNSAMYFDPNPEAISACLESVLFQQSLLAQLTEKGRVQAQKYSWSKMAEETMDVYQELF